MPVILGSERPVYAFQARGLDGARPPFADLSEMAEYYVGALLRAHPEGPYLLGGYSLGGLIAHEMARRLTSRGARVEALVMFDTYPAVPEVVDDIDLPDVTWKQMVANMFLREGRLPDGALLGVPEALHETRLIKLLADHGRTILPEADLYRYLRGAFAVSVHHREGLRRYRPSRLEGVRALYFQATRGLDGRPASAADRARRASFWQAHIERPMRVVDIEAEHFDLLAAEHHAIVRDELSRLTAPAEHGAQTLESTP
jgi:thioesterase domain-containing protein